MKLLQNTRSSVVFLAVSCSLILLTGLGRADGQGEWEKFPDGSTGMVTEYKGVNDTPIAAYLRKPKGDGPFPVVVMIHGGGDSKQGTYALGRMQAAPTANFIAKGWAVYSIDFRPKAPFQSIEWEDARLAVEGLKKIPGLDGSRVAMIGGSHGGYNTARAASRADLRCAIACAAAAIDPIEVARAQQAGEAVNQRAMDAIRRQAAAYGVTLEELLRQTPPGYNTPLTEVDKVRCPILLVSGRNDPASPPSVMETYAARLRAAGKQVELYLPDNGPHGFYFGSPRIPETEEAARRAVAFIAKHFGVPVRNPSKPLETAPRAASAMGTTPQPAASAQTPATPRIPEMFGALTGLGPALLQFDSGAGNVEGALLNGPYEGDREYFKINDPFHLAEKNADSIRGRTVIRLLDNEQTNTFTYRRSQEFIALLKQLNIPCEYRRLAGSGHNPEKYYNEFPGSVAFYATAFKAVAASPAGKR